MKIATLQCSPVLTNPENGWGDKNTGEGPDENSKQRSPVLALFQFVPYWISD
jgi:hypothetical protein